FGGYRVVTHILSLPFRPTNDTLHEERSPVNLDFLIPAGVHIDDKMTIREVMEIRFHRSTGWYEAVLVRVSEMVPRDYRYAGDAILFLFWTFLFLMFLRVFTFLGYGRALRVSLLLGGCTYYFMPDFSPGKIDDGTDFSPGKIDDGIFLGLAILIMVLRIVVSSRKKRRA
ncbi:MAG: hypothetical protein P8Y00_06690, partial [Deltaproteobacteria bacterium]